MKTYIFLILYSASAVAQSIELTAEEKTAIAAYLNKEQIVPLDMEDKTEVTIPCKQAKKQDITRLTPEKAFYYLGSSKDCFNEPTFNDNDLELRYQQLFGGQ